MNFIPADNISLVFFVLIISLTVLLSLRAVSRVDGCKIPLSIYILIIIIMSLAALTGTTIKYIIPTAPIFLVINILFAIVFSFSSFGKKLAASLSFTVILGLQTFRFPLELVLHRWSNLNTIPETMTWTGSNIDIIAGILCMIAIPFYKKSIKLVWLVQITSFCLLINVIRVAVMSTPLPFSWQMENPLQLIFHFPYVLIIPCAVTIALISHLLVFRKLLNK